MCAFFILYSFLLQFPNCSFSKEKVAGGWLTGHRRGQLLWIRPVSHSPFLSVVESLLNRVGQPPLIHRWFLLFAALLPRGTRSQMAELSCCCRLPSERLDATCTESHTTVSVLEPFWWWSTTGARFRNVFVQQWPSLLIQRKLLTFGQVNLK